jgi:hypothetical protein
MSTAIVRSFAVQAACVVCLFAQSIESRSVVGTVSAIRAEPAEIEVRPDQGDAVTVKFRPDTLVQRVAPGEKDLKKAQSIQITDLAAGDRVLVSFAPGIVEARRIVVMSATELDKSRQAERQDWIQRGVYGIVAAIKSNEISLRTRSFHGEAAPTVTVTEKTMFRRYRPGSVRFSDAVPSNLSEIRTGDQLRGRGQKSPDGLRLEAEEVVFGTFITKAGTLTAVDAGTGELTVKDLQTNKSLVVKVTGDSQIKRMPESPALMTGAGNTRPLAGGYGARPTGPGGMAPAGRAPDFSQFLERMPAATLAELKAGETVVFSTTGSAAGKQMTAIMLVANAEMLVRMATMQAGGSRTQDPGPMSGAGTGGMFGGLTGLDLSGMIP